MKKLLIKLLLLTLSAPVQLLYSQDTGLLHSTNSDNSRYLKLTVRSAPALTIEFNGHYDFGVFELSGNNNGDFSSSQFINGENFGVRHGLGGTAILKYTLNEKGFLRLCVIGSYNRFSSKYSKYLENSNEAGYANYNVITIGAGIENSFTPGYKFKPLIGIGLIGSIIKSGHAARESGRRRL